MTLAQLTASSAKAYRTCPRLYEISYERGYRPAKDSEALTFGKLVHRALEAWWRAAQAEPDACPDRWWQAVEEQLHGEADPFRRARALSALWGYHVRWQDMTFHGAPVRVLAVEAEFAGPLLNPETAAASKTWQRAGKIDAMVSVEGRHYIVEHKTTSEEIGPGADYWQRLTLDPQLSGYMVGARLLGFEPAGTLYDVIRKPALRPLEATPEHKRKTTKAGTLYANQRDHDETPEEFVARLDAEVGADLDAYYARATVVRIGDEERDAARDLWQTANQIRDSRRVSAWPRNPDACFRLGRRCPFVDVCTGTASLDDPTRYRRAERAHEELEERSAHAAA